MSGAWPPIPQTVFGPTVDERRFGLGDGSTTDQAVENLKQPDAGNVFVDLDEVDAAGHTYGSSSTEYGRAEVGRRTGRDAHRCRRGTGQLRGRGLADHPHDRPRAHTHGRPRGSVTRRARSVRVAAGTGIEADSQRSDVKLVDIAPTVLAHLGVPI